ncbi:MULTISPECIES: hypothetical protein [unclassified Streptomyces]|uniref:hypothetical protein n=1 Tax=unclassified Streptomyces TaxID=2593676 RepID=UPI002E156297|nr:hypothetical protein OG452_16660 [Streptomyces sp. NBC_01197]WSS50506.1 hypothetical protein OG708_18865 [Streptomyces sp. NBC_01180]
MISRAFGPAPAIRAPLSTSAAFVGPDGRIAWFDVIRWTLVVLLFVLTLIGRELPVAHEALAWSRASIPAAEPHR